MAVRKTPSKTPAVKKRAAAARPAVSIDFPKEGEEIPSGHYAIRLSASSDRVEISFDGKTWHPCREAVGHHWYDWFPAQPGRFSIQARARVGARSVRKTSPRTCWVGPTSAN